MLTIIIPSVYTTIYDDISVGCHQTFTTNLPNRFMKNRLLKKKMLDANKITPDYEAIE